MSSDASPSAAGKEMNENDKMGLPTAQDANDGQATEKTNENEENGDVKMGADPELVEDGKEKKTETEAAGVVGKEDDESDDDLFDEEESDEEIQSNLRKYSGENSAAQKEDKLAKLDQGQDDDDQAEKDLFDDADLNTDSVDARQKKVGKNIDSALDSSSDDGSVQPEEMDEKNKKENDNNEVRYEQNERGEHVRVRLPMDLPESIKIPGKRMVDGSEDIRVAKMPNFIHLEAQVFDEVWYDEKRELGHLKEIGKDHVGDNIIRWRYSKDDSGNIKKDSEGKPELESNARFVQWSDGSLQLMLGDEVFDVNENDSTNEFVYSIKEDTSLGRRCMEGQLMVQKNIQFRPTGFTSAAHREMEVRVKRQMAKPVKMKTIHINQDPEIEQNERMKTIEGVQRDRARKMNKPRSRRNEINVGYLEEQPEERRSLKKNSIKDAKRKVFGDELDDESEDDDSSDDSDSYNKKMKSKKKSDSEDDSSDDDEDDDEEEDDKDEDEDTSKKPMATSGKDVESPAPKKSKVMDSDSE